MPSSEEEPVLCTADMPNGFATLFSEMFCRNFQPFSRVFGSAHYFNFLSCEESRFNFDNSLVCDVLINMLIMKKGHIL
jgi:hypothetical protein